MSGGNYLYLHKLVTKLRDHGLPRPGKDAKPFNVACLGIGQGLDVYSVRWDVKGWCSAYSPPGVVTLNEVMFAVKA